MKWGIRLQVLQETQRHVCFIALNSGSNQQLKVLWETFWL